MTINELKQHLKKFEWRDIEFKEATFQVPKNAYESVSAFANTEGGWLVFGVKKKNAEFEILGVTDVDAVQNDFLSTIRSAGKLSSPVRVAEDLLTPPEGPVLVFYVSQVSRHDKPVYLDGDPRKSFVRRGGCDQRCNEEELKHFLRESARETYDSQILDLDMARCFDGESLNWYRNAFNTRHPGHETGSKSDVEFLQHFGMVQATVAGVRPTRAAVLLFGSDAALHQILPRPLVDVFVFYAKRADVLPDQRWDDRITSFAEGNIVKTWRRSVELYLARFAEQRFELDPATLQRTDAPPDYKAFRECVLNLLIHQDYGDDTRKARITFYADESIYWNSGASFVTGEDLFRQDVEKEVRNPRLRQFLNRIGIGEAANTGIRNVFAFQHQLSRLAPVIVNDFANRSFCLTLSKGPTFTSRQAELRKRFGVSLSDTEAALFLHTRAQNQIRILEAQSVTVATIQDTLAALNRLVLQRLLERHEDSAGPFYIVAPHLTALPPSVVGPVSVLPGFVPSEKQWQILAFCDSPKSLQQLMKHLDVSSRPHFRQNHLDVLIARNFIRLSDPTKPTSPRQTYVTTDAGISLLADKKRGLFIEPSPAPMSGQLDPSSREQAATQADQLVPSAREQAPIAKSERGQPSSAPGPGPETAPKS
jgi:ATP-dependent DNA helicase RecG